MADQERVHVKLGLSGTYWDKKPQYRVSINDQVLAQSSISADSDVVEYVEFDVEYSTDTVTLKIELLGKEFSDCVQSEDKTEILKDMLLNIHSVEIDEISLGQIPFNHSEYFPDGRDDLIKNCLNLGWNGAWNLTWNNPFYLWLLEKM
jgi:hypothetical protein